MVAALPAEIPQMHELGGDEGIPVRRGGGIVVELGLEAADAHIAGRRGVGVGLPAQAGQQRSGQARRRLLLVDLRQHLLRPLAHFGRHVGRLERGLQIFARRFVGAETEIQHAQFEPHARQVGIDQQHALERRHRALQIAHADRKPREAEGFVEIAGIGQHLGESLVVETPQLGLAAPIVFVDHVAILQRGRSRLLGKSLRRERCGNRQRARAAKAASKAPHPRPTLVRKFRRLR